MAAGTLWELTMTNKQSLPAVAVAGLSDEAMSLANFFEGVRVFVTSREKIKHPEGTDLFDEHVTRLIRLSTALQADAREKGEVAEQVLIAAYKRGAQWAWENGQDASDYLAKAAGDYADKATETQPAQASEKDDWENYEYIQHVDNWMISHGLLEITHEGGPLACAKNVTDSLEKALYSSKPVTPAGGEVDTKRLDFMQLHRVALIPEFEGPWDAEVYREGEVSKVFSGSSPREAIDEAMRNEN